MDIWFIYVVKTLLLPLASLLTLSFVGCFYVIKNNGKGGVIMLIPLVFLFLLSLPIVAQSLSLFQQQYPALNYSELKKINPQAIVVIGGGVNDFSPEYEDTVTVNCRTLLRIRYSAYLAKKIKLPILVSGGSVFDQKRQSEASLIAEVLLKEFGTAVRWQEPKSRNTAENAQFTQQILAKENIKRIILVTHAMHMGRAVEQFRRVGLTVVPAPTALFSTPDIDIFSFLPTAYALEMSSMAIHEKLGRIWYRIRY